MEEKGPEITFMFQFGLIRDAVTVPQSTLNLKTIKLLAVDFLNSKVSNNFPQHNIYYMLKLEDF